MKRIILCADDYGQNASISQAIVDLLKQKRLSATSCMVTSPHWPETAPKLKPYRNLADIGLHLNLTEGKPLSSAMPATIPLKDLLIKAFARKLDKAQIIAEFRAQLDRFAEEFGQLPDYLDGHHHIHQLPTIRDAVFEVFDERLRDNPDAYIRCTFDPTSFWRVKSGAYLKQLFIQFAGAFAFKAELQKRKIPHNTTFSGIYNFSKSYEYQELFSRYVREVGDGGIIMCHPGLMSHETSDEIAESRNNEYLYFSSADFLRLCNNNEIALARFKDIPRK
jgi:predicted glycoside hydrolase/deacetylase ChbG (UPF0249 family)